MRIWTSTTLLSAALFLAVGFPLAAQDKPAAKAAKAPAAKAPAKAAPARAKGKLKPVDINSATKNEIAFMLAIPEDLAAKIVAGRPYPTKARLLTNKIVSPEVYAAIKDKVVARQTAPAR
ncbi:MAG TPA: DNA-binding protein [Holophagaceae bacterium]|nr:DNA-binding protein [Holophagaceae bacterium]